MNRRSFIQSLAALVSLPANPLLSLQPAGAAVSAAATVPAEARSWAIYMHNLHGECTPMALKSLLNISEVDARRYVSHLIADGVLKPNPILQKSMRRLLNTAEDNLRDEVEQHLDMEARETAESGQARQLTETDGPLDEDEVAASLDLDDDAQTGTAVEPAADGNHDARTDDTAEQRTDTV
jgi:hypothetical protein